MLIVEHMSTWGFEHAIRGMRNPMNSWDKSDSHFHYHSCLDCDHQPQNCENDHKIFADCVCFNIGENDKEYWWQMIQLLPSSYNQKRTITMNYENVMNIINQRQYHKLDEWVNFVKYLRILPYIKEIRDEEK